MSQDNQKARYHRRLPHVEMAGATYFCSFSLMKGVRRLSAVERRIVFTVVREGDRKFFELYAVVVTPGHVHLAFEAATDAGPVALPVIMQRIKGRSAYLVNRRRGRTGALWLPGSHNRIIRSERGLRRIMQYIINNPYHPGLAENPDDYPFLWYRGKE